MVDAEPGAAAPSRSASAPPVARRFLDVIVENIEAALAYDNVEIIVSDRHGRTTPWRCAAPPLRRPTGASGFLSATDGLTWVEHYNLLLREARGKYARPCWRTTTRTHRPTSASVVAALRQSLTDAVLAFGRVELRSLDGFPPPPPFSPPPVPARAEWTLGASSGCSCSGSSARVPPGWCAARSVQQSNLYLRGTRGNVRADIYWVFGLSLQGQLLYVPSCTCTKRFYRTSTGAQWRYGVRREPGRLPCAALVSERLRGLPPGRRHRPARPVSVVPRAAVAPRGTARRLLTFHARRVAASR